MQYINHWPDMAELALPETVAQDLHRQLLEPFDSVGEAKVFGMKHLPLSSFWIPPIPSQH